MSLQSMEALREISGILEWLFGPDQNWIKPFTILALLGVIFCYLFLKKRLTKNRIIILALLTIIIMSISAVHYFNAFAAAQKEPAKSKKSSGSSFSNIISTDNGGNGVVLEGCGNTVNGLTSLRNKGDGLIVNEDCPTLNNDKNSLQIKP